MTTAKRALPVTAYQFMDKGDVPYTQGAHGLGRTFPHPIRGDDPDHITKSYYEVLLTSPFGSEVLADLLKFIDGRIGLQNCLVALTSDPGVAPIPDYLQAQRKNAGGKRFSRNALANLCSVFLTRSFGPYGSRISLR